MSCGSPLTCKRLKPCFDATIRTHSTIGTYLYVKTTFVVKRRDVEPEGAELRRARSPLDPDGNVQGTYAPFACSDCSAMASCSTASAPSSASRCATSDSANAVAATSDGKNDGLSCEKISTLSAFKAIGDTALSVMAISLLPFSSAASATRAASTEYGAKLITMVALSRSIVRNCISSVPASPLSKDTEERNSR